MTSPDVTRKLTATFSADVAGYSRLMQVDEVETVTACGSIRGSWPLASSSITDRSWTPRQG